MAVVTSGRRQAPALLRISTANRAPAPPPAIVAPKLPSGWTDAGTLDQSVSLSKGFQSTLTAASAGASAPRLTRTFQRGAVASAGSTEKAVSVGGVSRAVASQTFGSGSAPVKAGGAAVTPDATASRAAPSLASNDDVSIDQWNGSYP